MYMSYVYICIIHTHTHTHTHASVWGNSALGRGNSTRCPRVVRRLVERERVKSSRRWDEGGHEGQVIVSILTSTPSKEETSAECWAKEKHGRTRVVNWSLQNLCWGWTIGAKDRSWETSLKMLPWSDGGPNQSGKWWDTVRIYSEVELTRYPGGLNFLSWNKGEDKDDGEDVWL